VPRLKKKAKVIMFNKVTTEEQYPQHIGDWVSILQDKRGFIKTIDLSWWDSE
jgi:hypothetical protein